MTEAEIALIHEQAKAVFGEFLAKTDFKAGQIIVIGCSTSEVRGSRIGKDGNSAIAEALYTAVAPLAAEKGLYLAFQCCEHLNRALVVERDVAEKYDLDEVSVVPYPVVAETIQAHGGIDIGETLIGMHLKRVAVPLRLENRQIGQARVNAAFTRLKLIGGMRAKYSLDDASEPCII